MTITSAQRVLLSRPYFCLKCKDWHTAKDKQFLKHYKNVEKIDIRKEVK